LQLEALLYRHALLGIIPAGTLNHLARDLKLPLDEEEAARAVLAGSETSIDAAMVNGRVFVNNSVLGFFPYYRTLREKLERCCFGPSKAGRFVAVLVGLCVALWRLPRLRVTYSANGSQRSLRTPFVLVGNNEHRMQGWALGARTVLNTGSLWIYVMRPHTRWQLLTKVVRVLLGRMPRESLFEVFSGERITIESSRRRLGVGVDGEVVELDTPLHYESLPGALRVLVPRSEPAS
jgi:diacylglycerol kinase family enzyme